MKRVARNGLIAVAAASGAMAVAVPAHADSAAQGAAAGSPGLISGNVVQLPVHVPVHVCGNTVNVVGLLDPSAGNACANTPRNRPHHRAPRPVARHAPRPVEHLEPVAFTPPPDPAATLARTGADATVPALAGSAALLLGGMILFRRSRAGATH